MLPLLVAACVNPSSATAGQAPPAPACTFTNPVAPGADPWVVRRGSWYYLVQSRDRILRERMFELGLEGQRWADLARHGLITPALQAEDTEFDFFVTGKSELLPIPQSEIDLNPNVKQNPGW